MTMLNGSFHRKWCCEIHSQYLPDVSLGFGSCLVVLFSHLVVVLKVLQAKKQRKVRINSGGFYSSVDVPLHFIF